MKDIIRRCRFSPYRKGMGPTFSLTMWDTGRRTNNKNLVGYRLTMHDRYTGPGCTPSFHTVLFEGEDYGCAPSHAIDSDEAVEGLMGFLTLRPGDTDADWFKDYTPEQLEYCNQHAEALSGEVQARFCDENGNVVTKGGRR